MHCLHESFVIVVTDVHMCSEMSQHELLLQHNCCYNTTDNLTILEEGRLCYYSVLEMSKAVCDNLCNIMTLWYWCTITMWLSKIAFLSGKLNICNYANSLLGQHLVCRKFNILTLARSEVG